MNFNSLNFDGEELAETILNAIALRMVRHKHNLSDDAVLAIASEFISSKGLMGEFLKRLEQDGPRLDALIDAQSKEDLCNCPACLAKRQSPLN